MGHMTERLMLKMAHSKQQQIHCNMIHEVVGKAQASFVLYVHGVWRIGEAGTNTQTQIWRDKRSWPDTSCIP